MHSALSADLESMPELNSGANLMSKLLWKVASHFLKYDDLVRFSSAEILLKKNSC